MTLIDASGTVDGTSAASGAAAIVRTALALGFTGSASFTAGGGVRRASSALFGGGSAFGWRYFIEAAALINGSASLAVTGSVRVAAKGTFLGSSRFFHNTALVIQGSSSLSVTPVVDHHLPPLRAITLGPKTFRWHQPLQRGDLPVFVCDRHTPLVPFRVTFSLVQLRKDGSRRYVGPRGRVPVGGDTGEFYATGRAGESGQAGQWLIEWVIQRTATSVPEVTEMRFQVLDATAVGDPRDRLVRKTKFGWS